MHYVRVACLSESNALRFLWRVLIEWIYYLFPSKINDSLCDNAYYCSELSLSVSPAFSTRYFAGHLHSWDEAKRDGFWDTTYVIRISNSAMPPRDIALSHYDIENEWGSIAPQDGLQPVRNNIEDADIAGWW